MKEKRPPRSFRREMIELENLLLYQAISTAAYDSAYDRLVSEYKYHPELFKE